jgi:UDP-N-acetylglucosamine acyltransferase
MLQAFHFHPARVNLPPTMIHQTAIVHPKAQIDPTVQIGPYAVIDEGVVLGAECVVGPHVHLTGQTTVGRHNRFHAGSVIGDAPQDLKYGGEPTRLRIGDHNVFREHFTVHRSNKPEAETVIGSHCFLMAGAHVGHNCLIGDHVIIVNGAQLAGHVEVEDRVFISGHCLIHQFCRVGRLALMQGRSGIGKDLPPFTVARGVNGMCGLNVIGLRRAGMTAEERSELKRLYRALFRGGRRLQEALDEAETQFHSDAARHMIAFVRGGKRGFVTDKGAAIGDE